VPNVIRRDSSPITTSVPSPITTRQNVTPSHALGIIARGHLPFPLTTLFPCEVWCSAPTLWMVVGPALGFPIGTIRANFALGSRFQTWAEQQLAPGGTLSVRPTRFFRHLGTLAHNGLIFCDKATLPPLNHVWWTWFTGLMVAAHTDPLTVPPGWVAQSVRLTHSRVGGCTTSVDWVSLIIREGDTRGSFSQLWLPDPRPWCTIGHALNSTLSGPPVRAPQGPVDPLQAPVVLGRRCFGAWGLLPVEHLHAVMVVPADRSATGWTRRRLTPTELATAWNVPILAQEFYLKNGSESELLGFLNGPPGKSLHAGALSLLRSYIRGGLESFQPFQRSGQDGHGQLAQHSGLKRPRSSSSEADISLGGILKRAKLVAPSQTRGGSTSGTDNTPVLKQDAQKHDDAQVPKQLWEDHIQRTADFALPEKWKEALDPLRRLGWIVWNRSLRKSFLGYLASRTPGMFRRPKPSGQDLVLYRDGRYHWAGEGRRRYQKYWTPILRHPALAGDWEPGRECLHKGAHSDWWDWKMGSRLMYWRWPENRVRWARDGQPHFLTGELPRYRQPQKAPKTPEDRHLVWKKIGKVRERGYITPGEVLSLTHYFYVPKGDEDIRMVYNGTSCGLNDRLFSPHFGLPTLRHTLRSLLPGYYQGDIDIAEMFLNFNLGKELLPFAGVDVSHVKTSRADLEPGDPFPDWERIRYRSWERWVRNFMGMTDSPYRSIQLMLIAKYEAYGDRKDQTNPFHWERIVMNLPGTWSYEPNLPWVFKVRFDGHLACEVYVYVDDGKVTGWSRVACWEASKQFAKILTKLGIQDAARKRTEPSMTPGPWAGGIAHTNDGVVTLVSQKKWDKTQELVEELQQMSAAPMYDRKRLEQIRGYLIYTSRTYKWMVPYLKGIHLTIDGWREGRDCEGFKKKKGPKPRGKPNVRWEWEGERWIDLDEDHLVGAMMDSPEAPDQVAGVPRLPSDIRALQRLLRGNEPARSRARAKDTLTVTYLMGDASGRGFGSAIWGTDGILWESGNYGRQFAEESSNYREASNLILRLEEMEKGLELEEREIFAFTDNAVFEGTFYKGHSDSKKLNELVLRLRQVERRTGCLLHVIHVSGTRMKEAGIDGLSRGDLLEGMMRRGQDPMRFLPISQSAQERSGGLVMDWVESWWRTIEGQPWMGEKLRDLTPEDWFSLYGLTTPRFWSPPPSAMETVMELFNEDRLMNPHLPHVFAVPRLITHLWRKALSKDADLMFSVEPGTPFWPTNMHEPLLIAIVFPISHVPSHRGPWVVCGTPAARALEYKLTRGFKCWKNGRRDPQQLHELEGYVPGLWESAAEWGRSLLLEFLDEQSRFPPVQECLVRAMLPDKAGRPLPRKRPPGRGPSLGDGRRKRPGLPGC